MAQVFLSHAAADEHLVDPFVDTILKLGCGLDPDEIFYSSGEDTGVPSGLDLLAHVREQVGEAGLVIAIISPIFQTRPVCIAELGAAWSRTGNLFPLAVPGMPRTDMEGVLAGMTVRYLDDSGALDELHVRVGQVAHDISKTTTWGRHKASWLANIAGYIEKLRTPETVTPDELRRALDDLAGMKAALTESETERRKLKARFERFAAATTESERADALLPEDELERFETLTTQAARAVRRLDKVVGDALFFEIAEGSMPWPDAFDDRYRHDEVKKAVQAGDLYEDAEGQLIPDHEIADVASAEDAITKLREMLAGCSEDFDTWFRERFGGPPDLKKRRMWEQLIG
jgi:hypothetical protein